MERPKNKPTETVQKKEEVIGMHANAIINRNIVDPREVNKRMDALCMDEQIGKIVL